MSVAGTAGDLAKEKRRAAADRPPSPAKPGEVITLPSLHEIRRQRRLIYGPGLALLDARDRNCRGGNGSLRHRRNTRRCSVRGLRLGEGVRSAGQEAQVGYWSIGYTKESITITTVAASTNAIASLPISTVESSNCLTVMPLSIKASTKYDTILAVLPCIET